MKTLSAAFWSLLAAVLVSTATLSPKSLAQPATLEGGILKIPEAAAIIDGEVQYYSDVELALDDAGSFVVVKAARSALVYVDNVSVIMTKSLPPQVSVVVQGHKSVPCVKLQTPAISRKGFAFTIALAETQMGPAETCIALLDPFETRIPLEVKDLDSGTYSVSVNGVVASFSL